MWYAWLMKRIALLLAVIAFVMIFFIDKPRTAPTIEFIGVSTGTLTTDVNQLNFKDRFSVKEHDIVAVVSFAQIEEGTRVQATWFSPDDRRMPLGRKEIVTQSGAKLARFSISSAEDWQPAPYMLDVRAMVGEGEHMLTASGSLHFFIGMDDEDVLEYQEELAAYKKQQEEEIRKAEAAAAAQAEAEAKAKEGPVTETGGIRGELRIEN